MDHASLLGGVAGALTTVSFVPQVLRIWRTKSADDISYGMFLLFSAGVSLWLVYGLVIGATPVIVANAITLALAISVLALKALYSGRRAAKAGGDSEPIG